MPSARKTHSQIALVPSSWPVASSRASISTRSAAVGPITGRKRRAPGDYAAQNHGNRLAVAASGRRLDGEVVGEDARLNVFAFEAERRVSIDPATVSDVAGVRRRTCRRGCIRRPRCRRYARSAVIRRDRQAWWSHRVREKHLRRHERAARGSVSLYHGRGRALRPTLRCSVSTKASPAHSGASVNVRGQRRALDTQAKVDELDGAVAQNDLRPVSAADAARRGTLDDFRSRCWIPSLWISCTAPTICGLVNPGPQCQSDGPVPPTRGPSCG